MVQQACLVLVELIERKADRDALRQAVRGYAEAMMTRLEGRAPDAVMLGCTHYPLIADLFAEALPAGVEVLSQPALVARSLAYYLERHSEFDDHAGWPTRFLTTGDAGHVAEVSEIFLGRAVPFEPLP